MGAFMTTTKEPIIRIENVTKIFDDHVAVQETSFEVNQGEFFSLLGGSGSGKTTLLRMLAGFETPTSGKIFIAGKDMSNMPPYERPVNMMFQSYALFPHMNVWQNIAFGLKQDKLSKSEIEYRTEEMLKLVGLQQHKKRKVHQLSGGQRQRVALARCLAKKPKVLLLDEPLSALDKKLREQMQFQLVDLQEKMGISFVMVTHDQKEAMTMSNRIAIMNEGFLEQIGTPTEIYEYPRNRFTAEFIGKTNMFECKIQTRTPQETIFSSEQVHCTFRLNHGVEGAEGQTFWIAIRPEKIDISTSKPADYDEKNPINCLKGKVQDIAYLGGLSTYHIRLNENTLVQVLDFNVDRKTDHPNWEDTVYLTWEEQTMMVLAS